MKKKLMFVIDEFGRDEVLTRSAALAYYSALAMAPLIVLIVWALSIVGPEFQANLISNVNSLVGEEGAKVIAAIIEGADKRPDLSSLSGWLGLLGLLVSASAIFAQLQETLNIVFDVEKKEAEKVTFFQSVKAMFFTRLFSVGMLLSFVFLATISLIVSSVIAYASRGVDGGIFQTIITLVNLVVFSFLFAIIFKWMPDRPVRFKVALIGGVITSVLFSIGKVGISYYLARASVGSAYGAAGSFAVLLAWMFYSAVIFYLGAEVSYAFVVEGADHKKSETQKSKFQIGQIEGANRWV